MTADLYMEILVNFKGQDRSKFMVTGRWMFFFTKGCTLQRHVFYTSVLR